MRPFLSQLALLVLSTLTVYLLVLGVTLICVPPQRQLSGLDSGRAFRTLFATEPKYVFLNRSMLNSTQNKILLLGASNVVVGFQQDQLQHLIRSAEVNNLSVGGSNVTQLRQIVDLVHEIQSVEARRHNTFVIGVWYGLFADDRQRWTTPDRHAGDTDIDIERYRYGFFRRTDSGPVAVLPPQWLDMGVRVIHPYLVIDKFARDLTKTVRQLVAGAPLVPGDAQLGERIVSEQDKLRYLAFWKEYMGSGELSDRQFQTLAALVNEIAAAGGHVVIVDMPIPRWHEQRSPYQAEYRLRAQRLFSELGAHSDVSIVRLQEAGDDDEFSDEVHPRPAVAELWAQQLAAVLNRRFGSDGAVIQKVVTDDSPRNAVSKATNGL